MIKRTTTAGALLLAGICGVMGYATSPFMGWAQLERVSNDIVIGRCKATPDLIDLDDSGVERNSRGLKNSDIQMITVLKGTTNSGTALVTSQYSTRQGEYYLIFASYHDGFYQAFEKYRIVPLGASFATNYISGKTLDEQVRSLLRYRVEMLNQQLAEAKEEKKRLEEGLKP